MLEQKKILLGISGSIAAYKAATLVRLLKKQGAEVQVVATKSALDFITPLTLATLSENPVLTDFQKNKDGEWNNHVHLGLWADVMLIAPASANTMGKMANGICDNLLIATYLSARCPVFFAPAMDLDMYAHPSTLRNLERLQSYGNYLIEARSGELASGLVGKGRMAEPEELVEILESHFSNQYAESNTFEGKKVLITAGPTHEYIDPVRYISNGSSGKMGYAIAEQFAELGAKVTIVSGPVNIKPKHSNITIIGVNTAGEMYEVTHKNFPNSDIGIFAAAVADYTPETTSPIKLKKVGDEMTIILKKTKDIAKEMGKIKTDQQLMVGFALETNDELENARKKLASKNLDMIVLNSLQDKGAGFGHDTNKVSIVKSDSIKTHELKAKKEVAIDIVNEITELLKYQNQQ